MVWLREARFSPLSLAGLVSFLPQKRDGWSDRFNDVNSIYVTLWNTEVGNVFSGEECGILSRTAAGNRAYWTPTAM